MQPPTRRGVLAAGAMGLAALAGCFAGDVENRPTGDGETTWPDDPTWTSAEGSPLAADVATSTAVKGLSVPWDLTFADDDALLTERTGGVRRFDAGALAAEDGIGPDDGRTVLAASDLPDRTGPGEGGTLGIATHPSYPNPPVLFVYYTAADDLRNRVLRYNIDTGDQSVVVDDIPANDWHNGGRIEVGPDGHLWILAGDAQEGATTAQDAASLGGSVLRVTLEGDLASDNPDFGPNADPRIYTLGHRNPQGIAFTPDGEPLLAEHGPLNRDEVSSLRPGGNYGWNLARGGSGDLQYDAYGDYEAFTPPFLNTGSEETWAPSGIAFYTAEAIPTWRNRLFVAGLRSQTLFCVTLTHDGDSPDGGRQFDADWLDDRYTATAHRLYEGEYGRLRHVEEGPNGALYLLTSNRDGRALTDFPVEGDDRIIRVEAR